MKIKLFSILNKLKKFLILIFLLILFLFINAIGYVSAVSSSISNQVFRLHVIANSDSPEDQNLKYIVKDAIIEYVNSSYSAKTKEEFINNVDLDAIREVAQKAIAECGFYYPITVEIGNFSFPTKTYGDISLPSGFYDAIRINIGNATGKNWWCVMFPPLCFVDVSSGVVPESSKQLLEDQLETEEYSLISDKNSNTPIHFKFKIVEFFQNMSIQLALLYNS